MISQLQVLNKILESKDFSIVTLNNLDDTYFFNYKAEFNYIKNHYEEYHTVPDKLTFVGVFPDFDIAEVNEPDSYLLDQLFKDYNTNYLASSFNEVKKLIEADQINKAVNYYKDMVQNLRHGSALNSIDLMQDTSRFDRYIKRTTDQTGSYISTGFPELDALIGGIDRENENMVIAARTGIGKCLEKGTRILMADGTTKAVENIIVGDRVQGLNRVNTVLGLHNGVSNGYKIIPNKGDAFTISAEHILTLMVLKEKYNKTTKQMSTNLDYELVDVTIEDYLKWSKHKKHLARLYRPGVDYEKKDLKIDPYILGTWLGDGTFREISLTTMDTEIKDAWEAFGKKFDLALTEYKSNKITPAKVYGLAKKSGRSNKVLDIFREYDLINNKHIPLDYLTSDRTDRLELLAGLLDTDGSLFSSTFEITLKQLDLINQIAQLARGLGFGVSKVKEKYNKHFNKTYYKISIYGNISEIPTRLARKQAKPTKMNKGNNYQYILTNFKVKPVDRVEYYGFMCDGDERYLLWDNTLTHNTWTLIKMAAEALKQGLRVGIYSGEMSEDKVGYRLDTVLGHINNKDIMRGNAYSQNTYKHYIQSLPSMGYGHLFVLTPANIAGPATVDALQAFIEKDKLDILFIDQYSLLEDTSHAKASFERVANISKAIKQLQVLKRIPIISVSQMNRSKNEDGSQDTTQIGLSDRIGQDATTIIMLDKKESKEGDVVQPYYELTLNIVKARDGGDNKKLKYRADFNKGTFDFIMDGNSISDAESQKEVDSYEVSSGTGVF